MSPKRSTRPVAVATPGYPPLVGVDRRAVLVGVGGLLLLGGMGCVKPAEASSADAGASRPVKHSKGDMMEGKKRSVDLPEPPVPAQPSAAPPRPSNALGGKPTEVELPAGPSVPRENPSGGAKRVADVPRSASDAGPSAPLPPKATP